MPYGLLADGVVLLHLAFIVFAVAGGLLVLWRTWIAVLHVPAVIWAAVVEFSGHICPLTPLEQELRLLAGEGTYTGGFIAHYLTPLIYPEGLTREIQYALGALVIAINVLAYWLVVRKLRKARNADRAAVS